MRRGFALALAVVLLAACTAPAVTPGGAASPTAPSSPNKTATPTPAPTVEPTATTLVRTPEPIPTGSPQALAPAIRIVSQTFSVATAAPLIEVVGPFRTNAETELRSWVPYLLNGLDTYRRDSTTSSSASVFDSLYVPGPYAELIRQSLRGALAPRPGEQRKFDLGQLTIQHMYAKPWGRVAYIDANLTYNDRITAADGTTSSVPHTQQSRFANQGRGLYKVIDGYDPMLARWVDGEQPRWSALALEAEATQMGWFFQRESYVPGEQYPHAAGPGGRFLVTAFDSAWNDSLAALDASYAKKEFTTRRFDDLAVRISRFEPATFLGDGVVTVVVNARLVTAAPGVAERSTSVTRTLRLYRLTRDGLFANWLVVDEQGANGAWLSGGNLELAEIDQDRG
ncbi:MAG: hypothetical protein M3R37_00570 [Actinomycetota bacterium]|nr:hypothetical protein [Actinomycetota bacterium]